MECNGLGVPDLTGSECQQHKPGENRGKQSQTIRGRRQAYLSVKKKLN
jgi:hypothetical protein